MIRASSFFAPMVNEALFIGLGAVSLIVNQNLVGSLSRAFCLACSFCSGISSSVSVVSFGRKKSSSSSATSVDILLVSVEMLRLLSF